MLELFADNLCFFLFFLGFWADGAVLKPASPAAQTVHIKQLVSSRAPQICRWWYIPTKAWQALWYHPDAKPTDNTPNSTNQDKMWDDMLCWCLPIRCLRAPDFFCFFSSCPSRTWWYKSSLWSRLHLLLIECSFNIVSNTCAKSPPQLLHNCSTRLIH